MSQIDTELIFRYLDHDLTPAELLQFNGRLATDPAFARRVRFEQALHQRIAAAGQASATSSASLRAGILRALDTEDAASSSIRPDPAAGKDSPIWVRLLSAAAVVVILIGAGVIGRELWHHNQLFMPLEEAHWQAAASVNGAQQADVETARLFVVDSLQYQIFDNVEQMPLRSGVLDTLMGIPMGHFVFADAQRVVSVFVVSADEFSIPAELLDDPIHGNGVTRFEHNCRGCRLVYHRSGNVVVVTAESDRKVDLLRFDPGTSII